ncbi:MAG TPA: transferase hexapeptide repeat family protein [Chitinophagaceae bacterium]
MFYAFKGMIPVVSPGSFVHPQACVTGNVIIGRDCYIGPGAMIRGDWGAVIMEDGCNVQENCVLHMFPGKTVYLKGGAHVGHGAVVHGAIIGANSLIGMNSVVMDDVELGAECIVGALTFIREGEIFPDRSLIVGNPAKKIKDVSDDMMAWKSQGTRLYQQLPREMMEHAHLCEPLHEVPPDRPAQPAFYPNWTATRKQD